MNIYKEPDKTNLFLTEIVYVVKQTNKKTTTLMKQEIQINFRNNQRCISHSLRTGELDNFIVKL